MFEMFFETFLNVIENAHFFILIFMYVAGSLHRLWQLRVTASQRFKKGDDVW